MDTAENKRIQDVYEYLKRNRYVRNQQDFTEKIGSDKTTISQILNHRIAVPNNMFVKIEDSFPFINRRWIKSGEGEMLKLSQNGMNEPITIEDNEEERIPLLPVEAIAGRAIDCATGTTLADCRMIRNPIPGATLAIQVSGDSMLPEIYPGTTLYIKKILSKNFIPWGHTVVLDTIDGSLVKRIYPAEDTEEYIIAKSNNPDYPPYKVYVEDIIGIYRILGTTHINSTM